MLRVRDVLAEQQFDLLHLHEPMTPVICVVSLAYANCPVVGTWHAAGDLAWMRAGLKAWGFLADRIDARIAVSRMAAESAARWLGPGFEIVPNGVVVPEHADALGREHQIVFIGRHDARKGLPVLLRGVARDPARERRAAAADRHRPAPVPAAPLADAVRRGRDRRARDRHERGAGTGARRREDLRLARARRRELRDGARRGVRRGDAGGRVEHPGVRGRRRARRGDARPARRRGRRSRMRSSRLLADEDRRVAMGRAGRALAEERYAWPDVARGWRRSTSGSRREEWLASVSRPGRAVRGRDLADLVARARLARRPRHVHRRSLAVGRDRRRAQPALRRRPGACLERRHPPGDPHAAPQVQGRLLGLLCRALRERGAARARRRARPGRRARPTDARQEGRVGDADRDGVRAPDVRPLPDRAARDLGGDLRPASALGGDDARSSCSVSGWRSSRLP